MRLKIKDRKKEDFKEVSLSNKETDIDLKVDGQLIAWFSCGETFIVDRNLLKETGLKLEVRN